MSTRIRSHDIPGAGEGHTAHFTDYLAANIGTFTLSPVSPIIAGDFSTLKIEYTAGHFGMDDTGSLRICSRLVTDIGRPQFTDPVAPNYVTAVASNGAVLDLSYHPHLNMRPWNRTLTVKIKRGFLSAGDKIIVIFGDQSAGSPGMRMQTYCEEDFRLIVLADVFATCNWALLNEQHSLRVIPGPVLTFKAFLPTLRRKSDSFALVLRGDDRWGNPTDQISGSFHLSSSEPIDGLPSVFTWPVGKRSIRFENLRADFSDRITVFWHDAAGNTLCESNPLRIADTELLPYWADLHGQSGETVGTSTIHEYAEFARDLAGIDAICHQGNDFQITQSIWNSINSESAEFDDAGRFIFLPGYEWSGNTGMGGDRNVLYPDEGRVIYRSSHALVEQTNDDQTDAYDARELHQALRNDNLPVLCIPHVGGRYANLLFTHDPALERAVEVHSDWGTFDWLLEDAFTVGGRVGIVANSDGHHGRQGASHPGAATFGAYGGLTCILAKELSRPAIFEALLRRHHYATTNAARHFLDVRVTLLHDAFLHHDDPVLGAPPISQTRHAMMGDILTHIQDENAEFSFDISGQAPIERVEVFNRSECVMVWRPYSASELGGRVRVVVEGSEYRGRGRETLWSLDAHVSGNHFSNVKAINRWNLDTPFTHNQSSIHFETVTTGGFAGFETILDGGASGKFDFKSNLISGTFDVGNIGLEDMIFEAGGLGRQIRVTRLPEINPHRTAKFRMPVKLKKAGDNALYIRVTFEDGSVAWTSPIYLIASDGLQTDRAISN